MDKWKDTESVKEYWDILVVCNVFVEIGKNFIGFIFFFLLKSRV